MENQESGHGFDGSTKVKSSTCFCANFDLLFQSSKSREEKWVGPLVNSKGEGSVFVRGTQFPRNLDGVSGLSLKFVPKPTFPSPRVGILPSAPVPRLWGPTPRKGPTEGPV